MRTPNPKRMAAAVREFLDAAGLDLNDPNLEKTPERVAESWATDFLDGYAIDPAAALGDRFPVATKGHEREVVVVSNLHFRSMCPHHLMPYSGTAHIAYVPGKMVLGFGRLAAVLNAFAHRLILQEDLARQVTKTLMTHAKTTGAACVIEAEQTCLRHRQHGEQRAAITHAESYEGLLKEKDLRAELWARIKR